MTVFRYTAARPDGGAVSGRLDAPSRHAAAALLSARGLFPVSVELFPERATWWPPKPSVRARALVLHGLATLVDAGLPLERALQATEDMTPGRLRDALSRTRTRVREGASLGTAMSGEPAAFSGVTVGLVRAGERGVGLAPALLQAAAQVEREADSLSRVRTALAYPLLLAVAGTVSVAVIVLFVVPRFAAILGDLGEALPTATRLLIGFSDVVRRNGLLLVPTIIGASLLARFELARHERAWHEWILALPVIGPLRHALATARVSRTLSALLETGTPVLSALGIAEAAAGDVAVAGRLRAAQDRVAEGAGLAPALTATRALTSAALQLAGVGEQAGRLPLVLAKAADLEEQRAERQLRVLVGLLEPALIVAFAGMVAFVAAALLQAVYSVRPG
jgi:general secretion pathway protein F